MYLVRTKKRQIWKVMSVGLSFVFIFSTTFPPDAFAGRSKAGGGDLAEFDVGKWALGTAVSVGSFAIGSAVSSGFTNAWNAPSGFGASEFSTGFTESIRSWSSLTTWADKYAVFAATSQVSNAIGSMGRYYGWDPGVTLFVSSVGTSIVGGGFTPAGQFGGSVSGILNGMALGAISGAVEGAILSSVADEKGQLPPWAGPVAGLAGNFVTSALVGGFSQTQQVYKEVELPYSLYNNGLNPELPPPGPVRTLVKESYFSFSNDFNPQAAIGTALLGTLRGLPSTAISLGVNYLTEGMDRQDAYIFRQAFSGLYPVANTATNLGLVSSGLVDPKVLKDVGVISDGFKVPPRSGRE